MDFFEISVYENRQGRMVVEPNFIVTESEDLMVRDGAFVAVWDEARGLWSTNEMDVVEFVDQKVWEVADTVEGNPIVHTMRDYKSKMWSQYQQYVRTMNTKTHELDSTIIFANQTTTKRDYATKKLPYALGHGDYSSWDKIVGTLYSPEERLKIEWAIGAIVAGDSKFIQKFLVFYGPSGTGKSTILNVITKLFEGYTTSFDAKSLGSNGNSFAMEVFRNNPLVAIQHDGDLSRIEDNTKLNSIISHENMTMNEKFKAGYEVSLNAFLFMGTNSPVKISDAKSGIIRRLIDVEPSGDVLPTDTYQGLMSQVQFEYGAIAQHCLDVYNKTGMSYYSNYRPTSMMYMTDHILNFVSDHYDIFKHEEYITIKRAYDLYKAHCEEVGIKKPVTRQTLQTELQNYFEEFHDRYRSEDGGRPRGALVGFNMEKVTPREFEPVVTPKKADLVYMNNVDSIFDKEAADYPAQLAKEDGTPKQRWADVKTTLSDINTGDLHYVQVPDNHIVIDFDIDGADGERDLEANLRAAAKWPETYGEVSKSGKGVHLHYIYDGDPSELAPQYEDGIEIKVYRGGSSLRRKLTTCNSNPIAHISSGLPKKEVKMATSTTMKSEKSIRGLITRNLRKEFHPGTKPSVEFIKKILEDAYESGMQYDVTDMRGHITAFAAGSTNHSMDMIRLVQSMKFQSENQPDPDEVPSDNIKRDELVFFDVEVYPNLFVVCWKYQGSDEVFSMINPTAQEIEDLMSNKLVGFNNRRYDNHILYARYMGFDNSDLYRLSKSIINNNRDALFREAYSISYADIYDYASAKMSLKKWEIELGITHMEMEIPWDDPVSDELIPNVVEYCKNDVRATEAVFDARKGDFTAREILANLSGLPVNASTQSHTAKLIFGSDQEPQSKFIYTDLSEMFPGYKFDEYAPKGAAKSIYKGIEVGEGGYVYSEPGAYENVAVLDIASMHPNSIRALELFGPYTKNFTDLVDARVAIKHGDFETARKMYDGNLEPHLRDEEGAVELSYALKIIINTVYGLTAARFPNKFKDNRNKDNIVAKRGALFMVDLQEMVQGEGFTVAHIKTDSIKIPDATPEIIQKVMEFGEKYGYTFEHEETIDRMVLVNKAVYIARNGDRWEAVGAQFQHPYVHKALFTNERIEFDDYVEAKEVHKGSLYLVDPEDSSDRTFIGRVGTFVPVKPDVEGSGLLMRVNDEKDYAATGTKGYIWATETTARRLGIECVDTTYAETLAEEAKAEIEKMKPLSWLVGEE